MRMSRDQAERVLRDAPLVPRDYEPDFCSRARCRSNMHTHDARFILCLGLPPPPDAHSHAMHAELVQYRSPWPEPSRAYQNHPQSTMHRCDH